MTLKMQWTIFNNKIMLYSKVKMQNWILFNLGIMEIVITYLDYKFFKISLGLQVNNL
jgi:hypothetical protein